MYDKFEDQFRAVVTELRGNSVSRDYIDPIVDLTFLIRLESMKGEGSFGVNRRREIIKSLTERGFLVPHGEGRRYTLILDPGSHGVGTTLVDNYRLTRPSLPLRKKEVVDTTTSRIDDVRSIFLSIPGGDLSAKTRSVEEFFDVDDDDDRVFLDWIKMRGICEVFDGNLVWKKNPMTMRD